MSAGILYKNVQAEDTQNLVWLLFTGFQCLGTLGVETFPDPLSGKYRVSPQKLLNQEKRNNLMGHLFFQTMHLIAIILMSGIII